MKKPGNKAAAANEPNARGRRVLTGALRGPNLRAAVGKNIRKIRRDLGLTLAKMEERTGIDSAYIGAMERGVQNITMDSLSNLAASYGVQPVELICGIGYGVLPSQFITLDVLARLTAAMDDRVQSLLLEQGSIPVGSSTLASVLGALFEAAGRREQYAPTTRPAKSPTTPLAPR
ncbi:MAG: XRE family transcriptional regulator [Oxalobacteraceae bacterium]|nr:MAG: XRE family transcriptional regulator [Oxalobacteraceae bacterium]